MCIYFFCIVHSILSYSLLPRVSSLQRSPVCGIIIPTYTPFLSYHFFLQSLFPLSHSSLSCSCALFPSLPSTSLSPSLSLLPILLLPSLSFPLLHFSLTNSLSLLPSLSSLLPLSLHPSHSQHPRGQGLEVEGTPVPTHGPGSVLRTPRTDKGREVSVQVTVKVCNSC
jgi:hypothetical protein